MSSRRNSRSIPSIFASRRLWRSSPVNSARQVGADDVRRPAPGRSRARRGRATLQSSCSTRLVRRVGVVGDDRADVGELARRHGHARAGAAHQHGAVGLAAAHRLGGEPRGVRVVDRVGRPRAEVDRPRGPRATTVSTTIAFSGNPAWSNAHAIFMSPPPRRWRPAGSGRCSSRVLLRGDQRRAEHARRAARGARSGSSVFSAQARHDVAEGRLARRARAAARRRARRRRRSRPRADRTC